jgi:hypothetical protein
MEGDTHSTSSETRRRAKALEGYTVHLLLLDGSIATVREKSADDTFELTVELRDRKAERKLPAEVARNPRSAAFARAVREVKAELLGRRATVGRPG